MFMQKMLLAPLPGKKIMFKCTSKADMDMEQLMRLYNLKRMGG